MIDLHYWPTPNGKKVTILLEECEVPYRVVPCNIGRGDQFETEFLRICPNNRMPAMVDREPAGGGEPVALVKIDSAPPGCKVTPKIAPGSIRDGRNTT